MGKLRGALLSTVVLACSSNVGGDPNGHGDTGRDGDDGFVPSDDLGDAPLAYVLNELDSTLVAFSIAADGTLTSARTPVSTKPRHFSIDTSGAWLLVANQDSDNVSVFTINEATGLLTHRNTVTTGNEPQFVTLVPAP
jgi:6-phosphogluconolactonase